MAAGAGNPQAAQDTDYGREPCPDRILDDIGGAFGMGALGGGLWHTYRGLKNSPKGYKLVGTLDVSSCKNLQLCAAAYVNVQMKAGVMLGSLCFVLMVTAQCNSSALQTEGMHAACMQLVPHRIHLPTL